jgi:hypothetical protein
VVILCAYIFNIDTVGTCQYGPRYLLPAMAFGCLGLAGFSYLESKAARKVWAVMIVAVGLLSFIVNVVGATQGAMYCDLARHAFWPHWAALRRGEKGTFPLFPWLFIPALMCLYSFVKLVGLNDALPKAQSTTARRSKSSR